MKAKKLYTKTFNNRRFAIKYYTKVAKNEAVTFCWCDYNAEIKSWEVCWQY